MFGPGGAVLQQLCFGPFQPYTGVLVLIGLVPAILGGRRLLCLNEDMPEYHRRMQVNWSGRSMTTSQRQIAPSLLPGSVRDRLQDRQMASLTRHASRAASSRWSRVCRWQVGMISGWAIGGFSFFMPLVFLGTFSLISSGAGLKTPVPSGILVVFSSFMAAMMVWGVLCAA